MRIGAACSCTPLSEATGPVAEIATLQPGSFINFTIAAVAIDTQYCWYLLSGVFVNNVKSPVDDIDNSDVMDDFDDFDNVDDDENDVNGDVVVIILGNVPSFIGFISEFTVVLIVFNIATKYSTTFLSSNITFRIIFSYIY